METIFRISILIIFYTYIGYGLLLYLLVRIKRWIQPRMEENNDPYTPSITVVVTAFNEVHCIGTKIKNTLALTYPPEQLRLLFVTDGSDDGTPEIVAQYPQIHLLHDPVRRGKISAIQHAMQWVTTEAVVFTDANAEVNPGALLHISRHYRDPGTGGVAGEKRIDITAIDDATAGEGFYWLYESRLKQYESEFYSVIGAAGELFSIRSDLYRPVPADTIQDDFMISMQPLLRGYRIRYEPAAYATEKTSLSVTEESKRKVRIAAGAIQAMLRLPRLLLPFPQPVLWFEYISHRILRWIVAPYLLILSFVLNIWLVAENHGTYWLNGLLCTQVLFYTAAFMGGVFRKHSFRLRIFFVPYYFCLMNYGMIRGMLRLAFGGQTVIWEKAGRR